MGPMRRHVLLAVVVLAACTTATADRAGDSARSPRPNTAVSASSGASDASSPPAAGASGRPMGAGQQAALLRLAALSGPIDPAVRDSHPVVTTVASLTPGDQAVFDQQVAAARAAAARLVTTDEAAAAGYTQSSSQLPGIGTHWVKWSLVDQPFDPGQPAMLLYDQTTTRDVRLAGFSYWVRSAAPPDGFAGPNDVWHRHSGLCFEDGWLTHENVPDAGRCAGQWLNGSDLWMLHVWIAPGFANDAGLFAPRNAVLCPSDRATVPDVLKCDSPGAPSLLSTHGGDDAVVTDQSAYCHLPA